MTQAEDDKPVTYSPCTRCVFLERCAELVGAKSNYDPACFADSPMNQEFQEFYGGVMPNWYYWSTIVRLDSVPSVPLKYSDYEELYGVRRPAVKLESAYGLQAT